MHDHTVASKRQLIWACDARVDIVDLPRIGQTFATRAAAKREMRGGRDTRPEGAQAELSPAMRPHRSTALSTIPLPLSMLVVSVTTAIQA